MAWARHDRDGEGDGNDSSNDYQVCAGGMK